MRFAKTFFLAKFVFAPASPSAGRALQSDIFILKKVEACGRPGGISFYCLPIGSAEEV